MANFSGTLAPGVYIKELTRLRHPIACVSTTRAELTSLAARTALLAGVTQVAQYHGVGGSMSRRDVPQAGAQNLLHFFPAQGNQVSGASVTRPDAQRQFSQVSRLTASIKHDLRHRLGWAVFQPNGPYLWGRVLDSVGDFLQSLFQQGTLQTQGQGNGAYFVQCNSTTMTQADLANGSLVMVVGVAPLRPAEYVMFQIIIQTKRK